jgi:signal transduction histidine kinase
VFVRDRGDGFDMDAIAPDRFGVRESILGRMRRHGGTAEVTSRPGWGTEVRLRMPTAENAETGAAAVPVDTTPPAAEPVETTGPVTADDQGART